MNTIKVFAIIEGRDEPLQVGGEWMDIGDAAGDVNGGDFWGDLDRLLPKGGTLKEIRLVPTEPINIEAEEDDFDDLLDDFDDEDEESED